VGTWSGSETGHELGGPGKDFDGVIHGATRGGSASVAAAVSEYSGLVRGEEGFRFYYPRIAIAVHIARIICKHWRGD